MTVEEMCSRCKARPARCRSWLRDDWRLCLVCSGAENEGIDHEAGTRAQGQRTERRRRGTL